MHEIKTICYNPLRDTDFCVKGNIKMAAKALIFYFCFILFYAKLVDGWFADILKVKIAFPVTGS